MIMTTNLNYITSFPDFIAMQRNSFCWFLSYGILQELSNYLKLLDFSENIQYIIYPEEYKLLVNSISLYKTRKFCGDYKTQLLMPIEIRDRINNTIYFDEKYPLLVLPLMSKAATFYLNGCERIIISQIIRSPGVYFEKIKTSKKLKPFKRRKSTDIRKLRSFLPSGEAFLSESELFFATPTRIIEKETDQNGNLKIKCKVIPYWSHSSIDSYSLEYLKKYVLNLNRDCQFLHFFQYYRVIVQSEENKLKLTYFFIKWIESYLRILVISKNRKNFYLLLSYFNWLLKFLNRYELERTELNIRENKTFKNSFSYNKTIVYTLRFLHKQLNKKIILLSNCPSNWLPYVKNFYFLKYNFSQLIKKVNVCNFLNMTKQLLPTISFLNTLKDQLLYTDDTSEEHPTFHKYTKSKTNLLIFNEEYKIETLYHKKYNEKESYNAILIPEYGSWIRFGFQKNTNLNKYNYPLKQIEEDIVIKLDKINQKPVISLFKEMGLTDLDIYQNLEHRDFFYFTKPLLVNSIKLDHLVLRFNIISKNYKIISEFSKIFNSNEYRLNKIGRLHVNRRLNISISPRIRSITYEDIFAIIDKLITLTISKTIPDDIDHLKNRRVRPVGEILQNLVGIGYQRLARKLQNQIIKSNLDNFVFFDFVNLTIREFFASSQLSQYLDQTNPLSSLTHRRRISGLGPGGFDRNRISFSVRDIHPSHYGRICPIETPEGQNVGLLASLTTCARLNKSGFLETPFWRVINGKILKTGHPIYLTADIEDFYKIAPADLKTTFNNYLLKNLIPVKYKQEFISVSPWEVDFISISPIQVVSVAASLIPFFEHDDANRALMGSNMQRQSVPLLFPQKPIIGTGLENQIAVDSGMTLTAQKDGIVEYVTSNKIIIKNFNGIKTKYFLDKYRRSNQQTCINQRPIVWKGEIVNSGQLLTDGPSITENELALGQNVLVSYMPWQGYNFEDAILINERLVYEDIFSSIHIERYKIDIDQTAEIVEKLTNQIPDLNASETKYLNNNGIIKIGTFVNPGDILVGKITLNDTPEPLPESKLLRAIFGTKLHEYKDNSYRLSKGHSGRVIETIYLNRKQKSNFIVERIYIFIAQIRKIQVGDKIAGRHGNKGIISRILANQDMPFLPDGTPIDIILNPLGVPSRMNVGQLYECLLGLAGDKLNCRFKILPFDEMYGSEISRILINKKLRQASIITNASWLFNPYTPGKMILIDGRTGTEFENPVTVGNAYMLKLIHLVDDKIHARAVGPYSLITQQPLRGKAQQGGQRFGEMEVWALEGFGAAFTLKELLTLKSDDMNGRSNTLNAIIRNESIPKFGIPESFKVLIQELRCIGLDMSTYQIKKFNSSPTYQSEINTLEHSPMLLKTFLPNSDLNDIIF